MSAKWQSSTGFSGVAQVATDTAATRAVKRYECSLLGAVSVENLPALQKRLEGLARLSPVPLRYHEIAFSVAENARMSRIGDVPLRVRIFTRDKSDEKEYKLRYTALPLQAGKEDYPVSVLHLIETKVDENAGRFLKSLGYNKTFQFRVEGFTYCTRDVTICVAQIKQSGLSGIEAKKDAWMVEITAICEDEHRAETAFKVSEFGRKLLPLVNMKKMDDGGLSQ